MRCDGGVVLKVGSLVVMVVMGMRKRVVIVVGVMVVVDVV